MFCPCPSSFSIENMWDKQKKEGLCSLLFWSKQKRRHNTITNQPQLPINGHIMDFSRMATQIMLNHITCPKTMTHLIPNHLFAQIGQGERDRHVHSYPSALNCYFICITYIIFFKSASKNELLHVATQYILKLTQKFYEQCSNP